MHGWVHWCQKHTAGTLWLVLHGACCWQVLPYPQLKDINCACLVPCYPCRYHG